MSCHGGWTRFCLLLCLLALTPACARRGGGPGETGTRASPATSGKATTPSAGGSATPRGGELSYTQIDIGQGDSQLIVSPDGHALLVDGGPPGRADAIRAALAARGVERLDYAVATHPHNDHIGSLDDIVRAVPVGQFLDSGFNYGSDAQKRLLLAIKERGVPFKLARAGQSLPLGDRVTLSVLAPREPLLAKTESDPNNNSVVLKVTFADVRLLLTGDMEEAQRERLYADGADLQAEIYKVAHHGSHNGTDAAFMERVRPRLALLSCELGNDYGHPHAEALDALSSAGVQIYRTDLQGTLTLTSDGRTWSVATQRRATAAVTTPGRKLTSGARAEDEMGRPREKATRGESRDRGRSSPAPGMNDPARGASLSAPSGPTGKVVGNRRSRVYHVGGGGRLPSPENRIYFQSEEEARRAGYRRAGE